MGNHWSGWGGQHACGGQGQHGQEDAWLPSGVGMTADWDGAVAGRVGKSVPHHEVELLGCCSVLSSFLGTASLFASAAVVAVVAAAAAVAAVVAEVECAL